MLLSVTLSCLKSLMPVMGRLSLHPPLITTLSMPGPLVWRYYVTHTRNALIPWDPHNILVFFLPFLIHSSAHLSSEQGVWTETPQDHRKGEPMGKLKLPISLVGLVVAQPVSGTYQSSVDIQSGNCLGPADTTPYITLLLKAVSAKANMCTLSCECMC